MPGALDGVRILDLTTIYSGPICTSILGDQGADVIKIESPAGDWMRTALALQRNGVGGSFLTMNRNKRSMILDLSQEDGVSVLKRMVKSADVLVENYRPGVMERLGLAYETLKEINPNLIFASINGVGHTGPYTGRRVYDAIIQAVSGMATLQADPAVERPRMVNSLICDKLTSMAAAQAISAALFQRSQNGVGQRIDVAMLDVALHFMWPDNMANYIFVGDDVPKVPNMTHENFVRKTKDGYVCMMPVQADEWMGLFRALELPNILEDVSYHTETGIDLVKLNATLNPAIESFTTEVLLQRLEENQVPFAKINHRDEVIDDPQVRAMESLWEVEHMFAGPIRQARPPARFSETPSDLFRSSPEHGQHTAEVLAEFGFSEDESADLFAGSIVK